MSTFIAQPIPQDTWRMLEVVADAIREQPGATTFQINHAFHKAGWSRRDMIGILASLERLGVVQSTNRGDQNVWHPRPLVATNKDLERRLKESADAEVRCEAMLQSAIDCLRGGRAAAPEPREEKQSP